MSNKKYQIYVMTSEDQHCYSLPRLLSSQWLCSRDLLLPCPVHLFYQLTSTKCRKVPSSNHSHFLIIRAGRKLFLYVVGLPPPPAPPPEFIPIWMHDLICIGALDAACLHYLELLGWLISGVLSMWWDDLWFAVGVLRWRIGERGGEGRRGEECKTVS